MSTTTSVAVVMPSLVSSSTSTEVLCPSFFPRVPKQCTSVAKTFFDALTADSQFKRDGVSKARVQTHTYLAHCDTN